MIVGALITGYRGASILFDALKRRTLYIAQVQERSSASIRFMQEQIKEIDRELLDLLENAQRLLSMLPVKAIVTPA